MLCRASSIAFGVCCESKEFLASTEGLPAVLCARSHRLSRRWSMAVGRGIPGASVRELVGATVGDVGAAITFFVFGKVSAHDQQVFI